MLGILAMAAMFSGSGLSAMSGPQPKQRGAAQGNNIPKDKATLKRRKKNKQARKSRRKNQ